MRCDHDPDKMFNLMSSKGLQANGISRALYLSHTLSYTAVERKHDDAFLVQKSLIR